MYSVNDPSKRGVAPFGHLGIKACSQLPQDFRSVPRPSSPSSAKASTRCPSLAQNHRSSLIRRPLTGPIQHASDQSRVTEIRTCQTIQLTHTLHTLYAPSVSRHAAKTWSGITWTTYRIPPPPATDLAITTDTRVVPHAPRDATEPDKQYQRTKRGRSSGPAPRPQRNTGIKTPARR